MKSNGRRRWRKWARKVRDEDARRSWPPGFIWSFANAGYLRRHNANGYAVPRSLVAVEIPAKPFAAMSLVGMTMGARKRWARNDTPLKPEYQGTKESSAKHRSNRYLWSVMHRQGTGQILYAAARAKYRIGERLRPCPGCNQCGPTIEVERMVCKSCDSDNIGYNTNPDDLPTIGVCAMGAELTGEPGSEQCNQCDGFDIQTEGTMLTKLHTFSICDGSGILPTTIGR